MNSVYGNLVDLFARRIFPAKISFVNGTIVSIEEKYDRKYKNFIIPGFIDAHVHIESSMLLPGAFSDIIVPRGTIGTVSDPHEIANVLGVKGVLAMMRWAKKSVCKINFSIPSCVPATCFDGSGAVISSRDVADLAANGTFVALSEVMDVNAVNKGCGEMSAKLKTALANGLVIDGHAPLLQGHELLKYVSAGVTTDHETSSYDEAVEKLNAGMKILIREGSAAKNYDALKSLIAERPDELMFCTDDSHPDKIMKEGGIDHIVRRAVADGFNIFDVLKIASVNPVKHYNLPIGLLRKGDCADFIIVENLRKFKVRECYIDGRKVFERGKTEYNKRYNYGNLKRANNFVRGILKPEELRRSFEKGSYSAIKLIPGELITDECKFRTERCENLESIPEEDILKLVYLNRYRKDSILQVEYVNGFGLKNGAIASSVSHDSHNILAVGTNDADLLAAVNMVIECRGGIVFASAGKCTVLPLPVAGIMSDCNADFVKRVFLKLKREAALHGCTMSDPFMTLSFLALIVIPFLKIGERGLFEFNSFAFRNGTL